MAQKWEHNLVTMAQKTSLNKAKTSAGTNKVAVVAEMWLLLRDQLYVNLILI